MKQIGLILGVFVICGWAARVQGGSLDILDSELKEIKNQKDATSAQALSSFYQQLDAAMGSPDAAMDLYQKAGGKMPDPAPVNKQHVEETPSEKETREALDKTNVAALGGTLQVHCGLMRYAGVFVTTPDQKGLQEAWVAWLKSTAKIYPTLKDIVNTPAPAPAPGEGKHRRNGGGGGGNGGGGPDFKNVSVKDSVIGKYLGFHSWGDKEQGGWSVHDIPSLYKTDVLDPLRDKPTSATLAAWDVYIAMKNADQPDTDKWNQVDYPGYLFERACDDYAISPSVDKLSALVEIIKASPTNPKLDDMIARTHKLVEDYKAAHAAAPAPIVAEAPKDPNVSVTTTTDGDMTVITTHSNAPPVNPTPPPPAPTPAQ